MTKIEQPPLRIFISYAREDISHITKLIKFLRTHSFEVWFDKERLLPGQDWQLEIPKAVREADAIVICLSKKSVSKEGYVQREIKFALDVVDEKPEGTIYLIPARLDNCEVPNRLSRWQWVDLFEESGKNSLLKALHVREKQLGLGNNQEEVKNNATKPSVFEHQELIDNVIEVSRTRYLDCLDTARFSSEAFYNNVRLFRLLYVKVQFVLALISGDTIIATENQVLDSMGLLETFDELHHILETSAIEELPIQAALRPVNTDIYQAIAKNLAKDGYRLSLWEDLNTDLERRQEWARAIEDHKRPTGKDTVFVTETAMLDKLCKALDYFAAGRCVLAKDVPEEFANRIEQIISFSGKSLDQMKNQRFDEKLYIPAQGIFTSNEERDAAKEIVQVLRKIRNHIDKRITNRSKLIEYVMQFDCDQELKDGIYELIYGIYNQVLGIASSADIVQSSNFQELKHAYTKAGYSLATFIQETNNSHFINMYVPWEVFEYDSIEKVEKIDRKQLEAIIYNSPWLDLLRLNENPSWCESLLEFKRALSSLQRTDEKLAKEENKTSRELLDEHNSKQNELRWAWSKHIDNTRKLIHNPYWNISSSRVFFSIPKDESKSQLPIFVAYSHFRTKRDIAKDEAYAKWQRNLSLKGRMDARLLSSYKD